MNILAKFRILVNIKVWGADLRSAPGIYGLDGYEIAVSLVGVTR